jgi:hypothetical protein
VVTTYGLGQDIKVTVDKRNSTLEDPLHKRIIIRHYHESLHIIETEKVSSLESPQLTHDAVIETTI